MNNQVDDLHLGGWEMGWGKGKRKKLPCTLREAQYYTIATGLDIDWEDQSSIFFCHKTYWHYNTMPLLR